MPENQKKQTHRNAMLNKEIIKAEGGNNQV